MSEPTMFGFPIKIADMGLPEEAAIDFGASPAECVDFFRRHPPQSARLSEDTLREVRRLRDEGGEYLWQCGINAGGPETLFGAQITIDAETLFGAIKLRWPEDAYPFGMTLRLKAPSRTG